MFIDYYEILEIQMNASQAEIKSAFKRQALKWHPDRNPGVNTNDRMRLIIEAHLILKDTEARKRYNVEYIGYITFRDSQRKKETFNSGDFKNEKCSDTSSNEQGNKEYKVSDDVLNRWMENARKQALDYLTQTLADFKGIAATGASTFINELIPRIIGGVVILIVLALLVKACN